MFVDGPAITVLVGTESVVCDGPGDDVTAARGHVALLHSDHNHYLLAVHTLRLYNSVSAVEILYFLRLVRGQGVITLTTA